MRGRMSGGSYDYLYYKMSDAGRILSQYNQPDYRRAFGALMIKCADAMHDIEWVDSDDKSEGDDKDAIMRCVSPQDILNCSVERAEKLLEEIKEFITKHKKSLKH